MESSCNQLDVQQRAYSVAFHFGGVWNKCLVISSEPHHVSLVRTGCLVIFALLSCGFVRQELHILDYKIESRNYGSRDIRSVNTFLSVLSPPVHSFECIIITVAGQRIQHDNALFGNLQRPRKDKLHTKSFFRTKVLEPSIPYFFDSFNNPMSWCENFVHHVP